LVRSLEGKRGKISGQLGKEVWIWEWAQSIKTFVPSVYAHQRSYVPKDILFSKVDRMTWTEDVVQPTSSAIPMLE
jgi:tRNA U38,U39,U40 pseudouridine synthase TruA